MGMFFGGSQNFKFFLFFLGGGGMPDIPIFGGGGVYSRCMKTN